MRAKNASAYVLCPSSLRCRVKQVLTHGRAEDIWKIVLS